MDKVAEKVGDRFYFENPSDAILKKKFQETKKSYERLYEMAMEDNISTLDESQIKYLDSKIKTQYMPGALTDNLKGKVNRKRFLDYHELLGECKVRTIDRLAKGKGDTPGVRFLVFTDQKWTGLDKPFTEKYIVKFEDENFETVPDTDKVLPDKKGFINALAKIEPHWYIWRYTYEPEEALHF